MIKKFLNVIWNVDYKRTIDRTQDGSTEANTTTSDKADTSTSSTANDTTDTTGTAESNNKQVKSLTPQGRLHIPADGIDTLTAADEAQWGKDKSDTTGTTTSIGKTDATSSTTNNATSEAKGTSKEIESTLETTKGNFGVVSAQDLVLKFRDTIVNIEQQIINDPRIAELFMLVY